MLHKKPLFDDMLHASMLQMELRSESIDVTLQLEVKYEPLHTVPTLQLEVKDEPLHDTVSTLQLAGLYGDSLNASMR